MAPRINGFDPSGIDKNVSAGILPAGIIIAIVAGITSVCIGVAALVYILHSKRNKTQHHPTQRLSIAIRKGLINHDNNYELEYGTMDQRSSWDTGGIASPLIQSPYSNSPSNRKTSKGSHFNDESPDRSSGGSVECDFVQLLSSKSTDNELVDVELGEIDFQLNYCSEKQLLMITVNKCSNLPIKDLQLGTSDPYVKLQLLPEKRHRAKTRVLRKTRNPIYEETFTFFGLSMSQLRATSLHFVILSFDRFSRDDVIGEVLFALKSVQFEENKDLSVVKTIQPRHFKFMNQSRGELLVSLCHQPAANRLTVVILKARNLPKIDVTGVAGDPYVKLYLLYNGQRIAKKKTHVKKRTLNPVYNESFVFEVPSAPLQENLLECMSIEFLIMDWDRVVKNEIIGHLILGYDSAIKSDDGSDHSSLGHKHWMEIIENPRKQIAMWHKLDSA